LRAVTFLQIQAMAKYSPIRGHTSLCLVMLSQNFTDMTSRG
jgi:hypothetical protein